MTGNLNPYSVQISGGSLAAGASSPNLTPPEGFVWVITDIVTWQGAGASNYLRLDATSPTSSSLMAVQAPSGGLSGHFSGRIVIEPGTVVHFFCGGAACGYWCSGYQLAVG